MMVKKFLPAWPQATRVRIFLPSHEIRIFSITRGKSFILTHPLGKELYSCEVLLIDQIMEIVEKAEILRKLSPTGGIIKIIPLVDHQQGV